MGVDVAAGFGHGAEAALVLAAHWPMNDHQPTARTTPLPACSSRLSPAWSPRGESSERAGRPTRNLSALSPNRLLRLCATLLTLLVCAPALGQPAPKQAAPKPAPPPEPAASDDDDAPAADDADDTAEPGDEPLLGAEPKPDTDPDQGDPAAPKPAPTKPAPAKPAPSPDLTKAGDGKLNPDGPAKSAAKPGDKERPSMADAAGPNSQIYAEDWWNMSRPVFEVHGYYRVRAEFFHQFSLGRVESGKALWPQPPDHEYVDIGGTPHRVRLCGDTPTSRTDVEGGVRCDNATQAGANMRFRLNPELHISDNLRIRSQIDILDNVVLGSTPEGYANSPGQAGGYQVVARGGYSPTGAFASTQWAPVSGVNSTTDSIVVKRVWGEYSTPFGQLRFGRMPSHWGLGMFVNSGDTFDSDYQSTADRLMFVTGVRDWDLYFAAAWDFANEGAISSTLNEQQGQPYDLAQKDDVNQWVFVVMRKMEEQKAKLALARGEFVVNGGAYFVYRSQSIANDSTAANAGASIGQTPANVTNGYVWRGAEVVIPDVWFQLRYEKFRFEVEGAMIYGSLDNTLRSAEEANYDNPLANGEDGWKIRQFGLAAQAQYKALGDKLNIELGFGIASGDSDVESLAPLGNDLQPQLTADRTFSTFRFHPNYRVDLILWRHVLNRIQGAYYLRPSVDYDFIRDDNGQRIGGGAAAIWSRATEFLQTPGHARDLGVELNIQLYYQAKDGILNDDPDKMGGFFTMIQYGVLFPLDGLGYLPSEVARYSTNEGQGEEPLDTATAQTVRWYLGILY